MTVSRDKSVAENEPKVPDVPVMNIVVTVFNAAFGATATCESCKAKQHVKTDRCYACGSTNLKPIEPAPTNESATRCAGSKDNPCSSTSCQVHGRYIARGWKPIANNTHDDQRFDLTGYEDGDAGTYALVLTREGKQLCLCRVFKEQLYTILAHLGDFVEPAPTTAADTPNAGVETPRAADHLSLKRCDDEDEVSGKPEAGVDVSRAPSVSGYGWTILHRGECRCFSKEPDSYHASWECRICGNPCGFNVPIAIDGPYSRDAYTWSRFILTSHLSCVIAEENRQGPRNKKPIGTCAECGGRIIRALGTIWHEGSPAFGTRVWHQKGHLAADVFKDRELLLDIPSLSEQVAIREDVTAERDHRYTDAVRALVAEHLSDDPCIKARPLFTTLRAIERDIFEPSSPSSPSSSPTGTPEKGSGVPPAENRAAQLWKKAALLWMESCERADSRIAALESRVTELQAANTREVEKARQAQLRSVARGQRLDRLAAEAERIAMEARS